MLSSKQQIAIKRCESLQIQIDAHFGKLAGHPDPPNGPWDHWVREIKAFIGGQQGVLKRMGVKTQKFWSDQISANVARLKELMDSANGIMFVGMSAIKDKLLGPPEIYNGQRVVKKTTVMHEGRRHVFRQLANGEEVYTQE